jgi:hypothetical protein
MDVNVIHENIEALVCFLGAMYFVPTIVACIRGHRNMPAIFLLNLTLGWTFFGWCGALIWSVFNSTRD